ncbi:restriction endonuclease subunit S [Cryptosporangium sp. NPDC048952]|uniref:restriction endonuclease subunit S n=1 Tax=Cryptosporangium sp. NPDC048952 TaxID=3363961 RepID=UPI0037142B8B
MTEWRFTRLEDIASNEKSAISKPYGSAILKDDYRSTGVPVVRGVNLARGLFHDDDFVFVSPKLADKMPGANLAAGDLVFTHRGTIGQVSMIPRSPRYDRYVASTSHVKVRLDPARTAAEFYYYWFQSTAGRESILVHSSSVGVPGIAQPVSAIKSLLVPLPPLSVQRSVAQILGAIDSKIDANNRSVDLLVELADSRFTQASILALRDGPVIFDEVASVGGGGTPKTSVPDYWGGRIQWATPTDVTNLRAPYLSRTARNITDGGLVACSSPLYPTGSILMTSRATIGAFAINQVPVAVNQGFIVVNARNPANQWWLYHEMRARVDEFLNHANGATFLELPRRKFRSMTMQTPTGEHARSFAARVGPLHEMAAQLMKESEILASTRDELLPALLSGQIRVRDAELVVEEVV